MPKPVPIPVRRKFFQLAERGRTPAQLAVRSASPSAPSATC